MTETLDVLVVGSGASAVHAAWPLAEAGLRVRMLDVGNRDTVYEPLVPEGSFPEIRRTDPAQHRYFLGDRFEGVAFEGVKTGSQLTPPRQFISRDAEALAPVASDSFFPLQSLALGGLAGGWGAGCPPFRERDLEGFPVSLADLEPHCEAVAERIGVSGGRDDLLPVFGELRNLLPPVSCDSNGRSILARYEKHRASLIAEGFRLGSPRIAMLSVPHRGRGATSYRDMDFWSDRERSVYRPRWTLEELRALPGFEYRDGALVHAFRETGNGEVEVRARTLRGGADEVHRARAVVLAAGTLGTARIVLRSLDRYDRRVPLVCNPHTYAPMINLSRLGRSADEARHSLAQLCFWYAPPGRDDPATVGHLYSYRSLLLFKLVKEMPLPAREGLRIVRHLVSSFTILLLQHADRPTGEKWCALRKGDGDGPDRLETHYALQPEEERRIERTEREILARFLRLGCVCVRRVRPGHASSVHYAGTFPMTGEDRELTTDPGGKLRGTRAVWLADGSVFPHLPSPGLTFTMMANANRVGTVVRDALRS